MRVLLLGKDGDPFLTRAKQFLVDLGADVTLVAGTRNMALPASAKNWEGEFIVSYLSPWIVPESLLKRATKDTLNLHPGPPEYPGIGCTNFALYNEERRFGITGHRMNASVDTGEIFGVRRFDINPEDTVWSLTQRCYIHIWELFQSLVPGWIRQDAPKCEEKWARKPYRRSELDALCELRPEMSEQEMRRRLRAVTFPGMPGAYLSVGDYRLELKAGPGLERV